MQASSPLVRAWPTLLALAAMLAVCMAYFAPQLGGRVVGASDTLANVAMGQEGRDYYAATGEWSLWTNSMFGGMPTYQIYAPERGNLLRYVQRAVYAGFDRPIGYFFSIMAGMFLLLRVLGVSVWLSALGAIAFGLGTNHMALFAAGHMTKLRAISFMAPTLAGLVVLFRGNLLGGAALFGLALGLQVFANHPQMTYYLAAACGAFVVFRFVRDLRAGALARFGSALAVALGCAALAVGASYSKIATTLEYAEETVRGRDVLAADANAGGGGVAVDDVGMDWDRAMMWSNGAADVLAGYVFGAAGGSSAEPADRSGPVGTALRRAGRQVPPTLDLPLYHGTMPFTNAPVYFGAVNVFLFFVALCWLPAGWRSFFGGAVLITLLLSMGKNAAWLNRLLFDALPLFDNFRAPSSATGVTAFLVSAGGIAGLWAGLRRDDPTARAQYLRRFAVGGGIATGVLLLLALLGPSLIGLDGDGDARLAQAGFPLDALLEERAALLRGSAWRALGFVVPAGLAIWAFLTGKLAQTPTVVIVGLLAIADVWGVSRRYLGADDFAVPARANAALDARPVDEQILRDDDLHYRVHDVTRNAFGDAVPGQFHNLVGGYHAAKLRRYDDLISRYLTAGSMPVLNMLNTRYLITGQRGQEQLQTNPGALGNAWLARRVEVVPTAQAELDALERVDLATTAIVHEEMAGALSARTFSGSGSVALTSYAPNRLTYDFRSDAPQLVVFSEIWYGPDKGWYVSIDGAPAELVRVNYVLRAVEVPAGEHTIEMWFAPETFARAEAVSYVSSGLILLLCLAASFFALTGRHPGRRRAAIVEAPGAIARP